MVGFDNISAIREMWRDGRVLATADQHAAQLAAFGIEYALQILRGRGQVAGSPHGGPRHRGEALSGAPTLPWRSGLDKSYGAPVLTQRRSLHPGAG